MPIEDRMTVNERRKYLKVMRPRYAGADRGKRGVLLTGMAMVTGLHRKSLVRLLHAPSLERVPKRPLFRRRRYGPEVADVVRVVWESLDYVCAERLTPALRVTAQQLAQWEELVLTQALEAQLATISRATVQRLLQRFARDTPKLPRRTPQPPLPEERQPVCGAGSLPLSGAKGTPLWYGPTWAMAAWRPCGSTRRYTPSTTNSGCTTTCSNRCCTR